MKALAKTGPGHGVELVDMARPEPGPGEVLIRVRAASICGSDLHIYEGTPGYEWLNLPVVLGHEAAGVVEAMGVGADPGLIGKRVVINPYIPCGQCPSCLGGSPQLCDQGGSAMDKVPARSLQLGFRRNGGFGEYLTCPAANALPIGDDLPFEVAGMLESFAVGIHAVERSSVKPGDRVAVLGPGPIGLGLVAALSGMGLDRLIISGLTADGRRLEIARELGATDVVLADQERLPERVADLTGQQGLDIVYDCTGSPRALPESIRALRRGGELILVGISSRSAELPLNEIVRGEITLRGTYGITPRSLTRAVAVARSGRVPVAKLVTHVLPMADAEKGFELARTQTATKVILVP